MLSAVYIFAGGAKDKETTSSLIQETVDDRYHNIYNQPYDPDAKINTAKDSTKIGPFTIRINATDGWLYVRDSKNATLGSYSLKYQFWNNYSSVLNSVDLNLAQFYKSIDLSKTDLNRDKNGTFCGYTGAPLPAIYTEPQDGKKENIAKTDTTKTDSAKTGSSPTTNTPECDDDTCEATVPSSTASSTGTSSATSSNGKNSTTGSTSSSAGTSSTTNSSSSTSGKNTSAGGTASTGNTSSTSSANSSGGETSSTGGSTSTGSSASSAVTSNTTVTAKGPNADKNLVFVAKKHPTVKNYETLDAQVQKIKCANSLSIENAAKKIIAPAASDMEKARALFTWIACNVVYDYDAYNLQQSGKSGGEAVTANGAWKNRKAVCQGISELYIEMARAVGLEAEYVSGYAKNSDDYTPGMPLENHGWVVVKVDGNPILLDATWACVKSLNALSSFDGNWFDCDPYLFAFSHYPKNTKYLFISDSLTKENFDSLPMINPGFKKLGIDGKELFDFFKKNPGAWVPKTYSSLFKIDGLQINKMPFTKSLTASQSYVFNFSFSNQLYMKLGIEELKSGVDFNYVPSLTGLVTVSYEPISGPDYESNPCRRISVLVYETEFTLIPNWSGEYFGKSNVAKTNLTTTDGSKVDNVSSGKPKVIIFQNSNPSVMWNNEIYLLSDWRKKYPDVDIVILDRTKNKTLFDKYLSLSGIPSANITNQNIAVYIDSKNRFQFIEAISYVSEIYDSVRDIANATATVGYKTTSFNKSNYKNITLTRVDGKTVTNQASGKPKVIINAQFLCGDEESERLVMNILSSEKILHGVDLVILDNKFSCDSKSPLERFCTDLSLKMDPSYDMTFAYETVSFIKDEIGLGYEAELYYFTEGECPGSHYLFPSVIYIDSQNRFRWMDYGKGITASSIAARISEIEKTPPSSGSQVQGTNAGSVSQSSGSTNAQPTSTSSTSSASSSSGNASAANGSAASQPLLNKTNLAKTAFTLLDGKTADNQANGKMKVLVFFRTSCGNCQYTTRSIAGSYGKFSAMSDSVEILEVEMDKSSKSAVQQYANTYDSSKKIKFAYTEGTTNYNLMWSYARMISLSKVTFPVIVYIDSGNKVQAITTGPVTADEILSNISEVKASCSTDDCTETLGAQTGQSANTGASGTPATQSANFDDYTFVRKASVAKTDYSAIDSYVKSLSIPTSMSYGDAVKKITAKSKTEKEKARAIYDFIAFNISYNTGKMNVGSVTISSGGLDAYYEGIARETWNDRNGVCEGYGRLFVELCKAAGLNAEYISGSNKKYKHTYKTAYGKHGWNVVHIGNEHVLLDSCWGAGNTNGNEFTFKFKDEWFDVDPYVMIFSHFPNEEKYQYLSPAVSREKFDVLPRIDPSVTQAGISGKELYDFFLTHNRAWSYIEYTDLESVAKQGLIFNKILFAESLKKNTSYTINITFPSSLDMRLYVDGSYKKITSGADFTFMPTTISKVDLAVKDGNAYNFLVEWYVTTSPAWAWEATAKNVNAKSNIPADMHK